MSKLLVMKIHNMLQAYSSRQVQSMIPVCRCKDKTVGTGKGIESVITDKLSKNYKQLNQC